MNYRKTYCGKDFTLVVVGQIISLFGNAILRFALPLYLLKETGSSALFGTVTACALLPMILLSLLGGMLFGFWGDWKYPSGQHSVLYPVCHNGNFYCNPFLQTVGRKKDTLRRKGGHERKHTISEEGKACIYPYLFCHSGVELFLSSMITIGIPVIIVERCSMADQMLGVTQGLLAVGGMIGGLFTVVFAKKTQAWESLAASSGVRVFCLRDGSGNAACQTAPIFKVSDSFRDRTVGNGLFYDVQYTDAGDSADTDAGASDGQSNRLYHGVYHVCPASRTDALWAAV